MNRFSGKNDSAVVRLALKGEQDAFGELYARHNKYVAYLLYKLTASQDVEDLRQESFALAFKGLKGYRHTAQFRTWLHRIVCNTFYMSQRSKIKAKRKALTVSLSEFEEVGSEGFSHYALVTHDPVLETLVDKLSYDKLIAKLPYVQRRSIGLRMRGYTYEEIAQEFGTTTNCQKAYVSRGRKELLRLLKQRIVCQSKVLEQHQASI